MQRFFNTAGVCEPEDHYMLPPLRRLPGVEQLIDQKAYFVVHAPRQSGKSTAFHHLAKKLTAEGRYAALLTTCEAARTVGDDVDRGVNVVIRALETDAGNDLPEDLLPPAAESVHSIDAEMRLNRYLGNWCRRCPRPVVLFLDEVDAPSGKTLLAVLQQLRAGYRSRPKDFPHALALIGLRDVRDYRVRQAEGIPDAVLRELGEILGTSSPFNIKVESLTLRNFTTEEVVELYGQHTEETGQAFSTEALDLAHGLTRGQPWLVNALGKQVVTKEAADPAIEVTAAHIEKAKEALILRRDTHVDSLVHHLREARIRQVVEPILAGEFPDVPEDELAFVEDLGLVALGPAGYGMANPIYREIIPRALTSVAERFLPVDAPSFVLADGGLDFDRLLDQFVAFWRQHAESFLKRQPYSEAAAQLVCMAYLQRVVKYIPPHSPQGDGGGGYIDREYAAGSGRVDLCLRWPRPDGDLERFALELKVWRQGQGDPAGDGLDQLADYLERLGLSEGTLVIFDMRQSAPPFAERGSRETVTSRGRDILILRL